MAYRATDIGYCSIYRYVLLYININQIYKYKRLYIKIHMIYTMNTTVYRIFKG